MSSLEQHYCDLVDAANNLGHEPDAVRVGELCEELDRLDRQVRAAMPDRYRRETLLRHSRAAAELLAAAATRARVASDVVPTEPEVRTAASPTATESRSSSANRGVGERADEHGH